MRFRLAQERSHNGKPAPCATARRRILNRVLPHLTEQDRVSLVSFADEAQVLVENVGAGDEALAQQIDQLNAAGGTNLYAGLNAAYNVVSDRADDERQNRVILLSDGVATAGLSSSSRILALSEGYAKEGLLLSTIGLGNEFDVSLMRQLSVAGAGSFYFIDEPSDLREVFTEEVRTFMVPLATEAELTLSVSSGYELRALYGALDGRVRNGSASVDLPVLQIAHRESVSDNELGRRGGGGVMIAELVPNSDEIEEEDNGESDAEASEVEALEVGQLELSYRSIGGELVQQEVSVESPLEPGETPESGFFDDGSVEKGFVMLNLYAGMRMALEDVQFADLTRAVATLTSLRDGVEDWLEENPDPDIEDDLSVLEQLLELVEERLALQPPQPPVEPRSPWPAD